MNVSVNKVTTLQVLFYKSLQEEVERLLSNAVKSPLLIEARHLAHTHIKKSSAIWRKQLSPW